jgi:hypothetical protein
VAIREKNPLTRSPFGSRGAAQPPPVD